MTVLVIERSTPGLRGKLTRWLLEVHPGVFIGRPSRRVRERLWSMVKKARGRTGACTLAYASHCEQGFVMEAAGDASRQICDLDGLLLLRKTSDHA